MPNHCYNRLSVSGDPEQLHQFTQAILKEPNKDGYISIKQLVPMPTVLEGTQSPTLESPEPHPQWAESLANGTITQEWHDELVANRRASYEAGVKAKAETGYSNWWDWALDNWGTKWGDYDHAENFEDGVQLGDENYFSVSFTTAWCPFIENFWTKVSAMFPGLEFLIVYDEPGMCFAGSEKYANGQTIYAEYIDDTTKLLPDVDFDDTEAWEAYEDAKSNLMDQLLERAEAS